MTDGAYRQQPMLRRVGMMIACTSETVGIMCLDNDTGHFFNVSRDSYQVG